MKERIKELCKLKKVSMNTAESEMGLAKGYLSKLGKSNPNARTLQKMSDYFGVSVKFILTGKEESTDKDAMLSLKDERDIAKDLDSIMNKLSCGENGPATFDGQPLSPESAELFKDQLEIMLRNLKIINKEKYNPNKNKGK